MAAGADPEIFARKSSQDIIVFQTFCTISPFNLIALAAIGHHVFFRNNFCMLAVSFSRACSQKSAVGDGYLRGTEGKALASGGCIFEGNAPKRRR